MPQVEAGDKTGVYYIPVAGLPWGCTWQKLKDFARNQQPDGSCIDIDHAMVYQNSETAGWVRVQGKENFRKALAHLDGGVLDGKAILADGRNETDATLLADVLPPSYTTSLPRRHRGSSSSARESSHQSNYQTSSMSTAYTGSEGEWYYQPAPTTYSPMAPSYATYVDYSVPTTSGIVYAGQMAPSTPVYVTSPQPVVSYSYMSPMSMPYADPPTSPMSMAGSTHFGAPPSPVIKTEARKIIITQLPHSTNETDLATLLTSTIAKSSRNYTYTALQEISIARHPDGTTRGHAFATLESHHLAASVIKALDSSKYKGRTIAARFAKEGAPSSTPSLTPASTSTEYFANGSEYGMMSPPPPSQKASGSGGKERKSKSSGSGKSSSRKSKRDGEGRHREREREQEDVEREVQGEDSPIVVDGSSRRHHRRE